jgi:hypoxanthine phosphoribosyltransferase
LNRYVLVNDVTVDIKGRHVVLIEDIVDTGLTLEALKGRVLDAGAASCAIVTLLNKTSRRRNGMHPDYTGFECQDQFVVGYGLDFDSKYRELPYIGVLKPEIYATEK